MINVRSIPVESRQNYIVESWSALFYGLYIGMLIPFVSVVATRLEAPSTYITFLAMTTMIGLSLTWLWAIVSRNVNKVVWVVATSLVSRGSLFLFLWIREINLYLIIFIIYSLTECAAIPAYGWIVKNIYQDAFRKKALSYIRTLSTGTTLIGTVLGGQLLDWLGINGFQVVFPLAGLMGIISAIIFSNIKINPQQNNNFVEPMLTTLIRIFRKPTLLSFFMVFFVAGTGNLIGACLYPMFYVKKLHLSNTIIGLFSGLQTLMGSAFFYWWGGKPKDSHPHKTIILCLIGASFIPLLYYLADSISLIWLAVTISGITINAWDLALFNYLIEYSNSSSVLNFTSIDSTMRGIRGIYTPFISAYLYQQFNFKPTFLLSFITMIISIVIYSILPHLKINESLGEATVDLK